MPSFDELSKRYGTLRRLEDMPKDAITNPAAVLKAPDPKGQVIRRDYKRALELWQKRAPQEGETLPDLFAGISDVTQAPEEVVGRNRLVLKARDSKELMYYTTDDE